MKFKDLVRSGYSAWVNNSIVRVMKIMVLIMTTFLLQVSAAGFAQKLTFTRQNASLKELFTEIRKQTGYNVFWQEGKVNDAMKVNVSFKDAPLDDVLKKTLSGHELSYKIVNQTVVVTKKEKSFLETVSDYLASINVEGKIVDASTNLPIPKVSVTLKGSTRSVVADERGNFRFNSLPDEGTLIFSSIGFVTQEVKIRESMEVRMVMATQLLEDVTVSTGYQSVKKSSTTGSFSVLTAKDIESTPSVNLMERIEVKYQVYRWILEKILFRSGA